MVEYCEESARRNPFVEDFTLHGVPLSIHIELQLFSATIADQILATRHNQILVCDKTPASLLAYTNVLLGSQLSADDGKLLDAMTNLFREWCRSYDVIFVLRDKYNLDRSEDGVRAKVLHLQEEVGSRVQVELERACAAVMEIPAGMTLDDRVDWIIRATEDRLGPFTPST